MSFFRLFANMGRRAVRTLTNSMKAVAGELFWDGRENPVVIPGKSRHVTTWRQKDVIGGSGEANAEIYLRKKGWRILEKNFVLPSCEFDLIALDSGTLVFVEVKTRRNENYADPLIEVDRRRQKKMIHAQREFFRWRGVKSDAPFRFDIVVVLENKDGDLRFNHLEDAFHSGF